MGRAGLAGRREGNVVVSTPRLGPFLAWPIRCRAYVDARPSHSPVDARCQPAPDPRPVSRGHPSDPPGFQEVGGVGEAG